MTSEQVLLILTLWLSAIVGGCDALPFRQPSPPLPAVYATRQVWAVAPLRNESGTRAADGLKIADHLARQLEQAPNLDVLPVNRVLAAMEAANIEVIRTPEEAMAVLDLIEADAIVLGTISAYDPYDPPKLGLALELFHGKSQPPLPALDLRELTRTGTDPGPEALPAPLGRPINRVSAFLDAADPEVRTQLQRYALKRGPNQPEREAWHLYRISMDLFTEFASYAMSWRLLQAEASRLSPPAAPPTNDPAL